MCWLRRIATCAQLSSTGWWFGTWISFFHILGIIIPIDFLFFRGVAKNHQPVIDDFPIYHFDFPSYKPPFIHPKLRSETSETAVEVDPNAAMVDLWCGRRLGVDERCRVYSAKMGWSQRWAPQKGSLTWLDWCVWRMSCASVVLCFWWHDIMTHMKLMKLAYHLIESNHHQLIPRIHHQPTINPPLNAHYTLSFIHALQATAGGWSWTSLQHSHLAKPELLCSQCFRDFGGSLNKPWDSTIGRGINWINAVSRCWEPQVVEQFASSAVVQKLTMENEQSMTQKLQVQRGLWARIACDCNRLKCGTWTASGMLELGQE